MDGFRWVFGGGISDLDTMLPCEASARRGSYNFELSPFSSNLVSRYPYTAVNSTISSSIAGLAELNPRAGSPFLMIQSGATVRRYSTAGATMSSIGSCATSSSLRGEHWELDDYLVITDLEKATPVSRFSGTTFGTLTTGLGSSLYAKYAVVHLGRVWLFNVTTTTDTPHLLVASAFENPTSYDTTLRAGSSTFTSGTEAFYMTTPDLRAINGVVRFYDTLVISTKGGSLFKLVGSDSTNFEFVPLYEGSYAIHQESLAVAGNDIYYVREGGRVESVKTSDKYGDILGDEVSRWIPETAKGTVASTAFPVISVYDPNSSKVLFIPRGRPQQKMLALYVSVLAFGGVMDVKGARGPVSPWSLHQDTTATELIQCAIYSRHYGGIIAGVSTGRILQLSGQSSASTVSSNVTMVRFGPILDKSSGIDPMRTKRGVIRYSVTAPAVTQTINTTEWRIAAQFEDQARTSSAAAPTANTYVQLRHASDGTQTADIPLLVSRFTLGGAGEYMEPRIICETKPHFYEITEVRLDT